MHVPVLLQETLEYLNAKKGQRFIDGTAGGGGHLKAILEINPKAEVLGIDWDQASLEKLREEFVRNGLSLPAMRGASIKNKALQAGQRSILVHGNYKDLEKFAAENQFERVDGILIDLGFSSLQLDDPSRGLSFQTDGPLDMRYSRDQTLTAEKIVNDYSEAELERVLREFGEERLSRHIARAIVRARAQSRIDSTLKLSEVISTTLPKPVRHKAKDYLRRVFQALRIEVNHELDNLTEVLPKALKILKPGGRLVIISFHSLEDRIVKRFFLNQANDCVCPPEFPTCICDRASSVKILTRKPITPTEAEILINQRSKPAKLRAIQKI